MRNTALRDCICWVGKRERAMWVMKRKPQGSRKDNGALERVFLLSSEKWISENKGIQWRLPGNCLQPICCCCGISSSFPVQWFVWSFEPEQRSIFFFPFNKFFSQISVLTFLTLQPHTHQQRTGFRRSSRALTKSLQPPGKLCVSTVQPKMSEMQARLTEVNDNRFIHHCSLGSTQYDLKQEKCPNIETCLDLSGHKSPLKSGCNSFYLSSAV